MVKALRLAAYFTFKMHVIMLVVVRCSASGAAKGILHGPGIVQYLVDNTLFEKGIEGAVDGHTVAFSGKRSLNFGLAQGYSLLDKQGDNPFSYKGLPKAVLLENIQC